MVSFLKAMVLCELRTIPPTVKRQQARPAICGGELLLALYIELLLLSAANHRCSQDNQTAHSQHPQRNRLGNYRIHIGVSHIEDLWPVVRVGNRVLRIDPRTYVVVGLSKEIDSLRCHSGN